jgi:6-phosphogluconolactonase/glucosamine-6-phosphate isomerase/deaminase
VARRNGECGAPVNTPAADIGRARVLAVTGPDGTPRVSLTQESLASARNLYVLIHGPQKKAVLEAALDAEAPPLP